MSFGTKFALTWLFLTIPLGFAAAYVATLLGVYLLDGIHAVRTKVSASA